MNISQYISGLSKLARHGFIIIQPKVFDGLLNNHVLVGCFLGSWELVPNLPPKK